MITTFFCMQLFMKETQYRATDPGPTNRRAPGHRVEHLLQVLHCANARGSMVSNTGSEAKNALLQPNRHCQLDWTLSATIA